jgi:hypothetical protein
VQRQEEHQQQAAEGDQGVQGCAGGVRPTMAPEPGS